jgi:hypothetical protein
MSFNTKSITADETSRITSETLEKALELLTDPITGSKARGMKVIGTVSIHVDDSFITGTPEFMKWIRGEFVKQFQIGSEDTNDVMFVGQRVKWIMKDGKKEFIKVDQEIKIEELGEIEFNSSLRDDLACDHDLHKQYRSVLGQANWLQSRTQYQSCFSFSRCASAAAAPNIGHVRMLNKLVRKIRHEVVYLAFWPLNKSNRVYDY